MKIKKFKISVVVRNTIANYTGNLLTALIAFLFIPVYIRYLGIGSYGIIGFFASLQVFFSFLDLGIGIAINREMSRYYHDPAKAQYLNRLTHSLQVVYWGIGIAIGIILFALSPLLSRHWFAGNEVSPATQYTAFIILSFTLAFRWPYTLYSSGIRGMQHQVVLNVHDFLWAVVKNAGSWLVLKYYSPTLEAFLWYQCIITFLQTASICIIVWIYMPAKEGVKKFVFDKQVLKDISRYAAGMGAASLLASIIMQLDKILVSKMVSQSQFGYYMVATNVAVLVYNASLPIYVAIFPHFARLAHSQQLDQLKKDFHFYSKLLSTLLIPFSAVVFFAADQVLWLWTKDMALSHTTAPILQIMIVGTTLNACITTVHTLLMAYGKVKILFYTNLIACIAMVPLVLLLVHFYGVKGGAISISFLYASLFLVQGSLILKSLGLQKIALQWYIGDILQCLIPVSLVVFLATHYWLSSTIAWTKTELLLKLMVIGLVACFVAVLSNDALRARLANKLFRQSRKVNIQ